MSIEDLAAGMLRLLLANLVLCKDDLQEEDAYFWSMLYAEEEAGIMSKEITAYCSAKRRMRESRAGNPGNVVAVLLYNVSHTGTRNREIMAKWRVKLKNGYSLPQVKRLDQAMDLIEELKGSYLTEHDIGFLLGHSVNIGRVAKLVQEEYRRLEGE